MNIVEYDTVDPLKVMHLTSLALDFALTPEMIAQIRRSDPRPFPCLAIYAVRGESVLGQAGIFRLPLVSTEGREDVGGIWAVAAHPGHAGRGVASLLLDEAHDRMRRVGLRFSTLVADRSSMAHKLFRRHGYEETNVWATALARWETAHQPTRLRARPAEAEGYDFVEQVFMDIAKHYLGFAWRHIPFAPLRQVSLIDIWILHENTRIVGYAIVRADQTMLAITDLVLQPEIDAAEAISALAAELKSAYVQVRVSRPVDSASLARAGYLVAHPTRSSFMIKPLAPGATAADAMQLFATGTDRFLISWLDVTKGE